MVKSSLDVYLHTKKYLSLHGCDSKWIICAAENGAS